MESCEDLSLESLSDNDYVKQGFCLWINNEPLKAVEFLQKRNESLSVEYGAALLQFFNALISFDRNKIGDASSMLRELERKCTPEQGWFKSIRTKLFGEQRDFASRKSILNELEREIILADVLLCSSILIGISCDVSSYIKAALILRRVWKIYNQAFKEIHELCTEYFAEGSQMDIGSFELSMLNNNNNQEIPSPTSSENSNWTVPSLMNHNVPQHSANISKSHSTIFSTQKESRLKKLSKHVAMSNFQMKSESSDGDISLSDFKKELHRLRGAIYFGYGLLQIAFSFIPPQLKVINFLGYQGDRETGLNCLKDAKNSQDLRGLMSIIALLYYYLIIVPFFSLENSNLSKELTIATEILNENERFDSSALFLFFSGRRQRLKKKMKFAIMHYDAALRVANLPRELKMLVMHELGLCLLIELNFHDAMHYFNELKVSKFSKSYYIYLTTICCGTIEPADEKLTNIKQVLQKIIGASSQRDGIIERFLMNRCNHAIPDEERDPIYWKLLCYEIMYLWNLLSSCSSETLQTIIEDCKSVDESPELEPFLGLSQFLIGASCYVLNEYENAIFSYRKCIELCNENPSKLKLIYLPAYANYELAVVLMKNAVGDYKDEAQKLLQNAQMYKNYDFEHRLKLKIYNMNLK